MTTPSSIWYKRAFFRACHRGGKEADHVFGAYMMHQGPGLSDSDLRLLGDLFLHDDVDVYDWLRGVSDVPAAYQGPAFDHLRTYFLAI